MSEEQPEFPIVAAIFHTILFAYQKSVRNILGSGQAIFVHPVIETIKKIKEDVTCPLAILAMSVFEEVTGKKVKFAESKYSDFGTETIIEPL